jgi:hypothetical protein
MNKIAFNPLTGKFDLVGGASFESVAVTVTSANVWTSVPLTTITMPHNAETYNQTNNEKVTIDVRINGSAVEIRAKQLRTYTIRVEGY